jgi:hypothetical protein
VYGPANYAFYHGKVLFITLDNVVDPNSLTSSNYIGGYRRTVPKDHLVVISGHIPIFDEFPLGMTFSNAHRRRLYDLLKVHPHHHYNVGTAGMKWTNRPRQCRLCARRIHRFPTTYGEPIFRPDFHWEPAPSM